MCPRPPVARFSCPPPRHPLTVARLVETARTACVPRRPLRRKTPIHVGALSQRIGVALSPSARGPNKQGSSPQERRARKADAKVKARTEVSCHLQGSMRQPLKWLPISFSGRHSRFSEPSTVEKSVTVLCACPSQDRFVFLVETGGGPVGFYALPPRESGIDADKSKQDSGADDDPYP